MNMKKFFIRIFSLVLLLNPNFSHSKALQMDYASKKQEVWRATLLSLSSYPLEINNFEEGLIKTKVLTESEVWSPIYRSPNSDHLYTMSISVYDSNYGTKVSINKKLKRKADFNRSEEELETKGVEEDLILYRVKRELLVDRLIKKHLKGL